MNKGKKKAGKPIGGFIWGLLFPAFAFLGSCMGSSSRNSDTPNQGTILIAADNTIQPIIEQELDIFRYDYPDAKINCIYLPENEIFKKILKDSISFAITTRVLNSDERSHFTNRKIEIYEHKIASDAIALIVNKSNPDTSLYISQVQKILNGNMQTWAELGNAGFTSKIQVILDQNGSSIQRGLIEKLGVNSMSSPLIYSLKGNSAVAQYVASNPNSIGFIGMNWLNNNDSISSSLASKVRLVGVSPDAENTRPTKFYHPYVASIYTKKYPFSRSLFTLSVEGHTGLGTGFAVFLASDKGQLIFSKSGVLPIRGASREILIK